jgi:hypothetical protein
VKRSGRLARRTAMSRRSAKGQSYHDEYIERALLVKRRSGGRCEIRAVHGCDGRASDFPHHRKLRSQGGSNSLDNLLDVCISGHYWIHRILPREHAEHFGLLIPREERETPY